MPALPWPVPEQAAALYAGYLDWLHSRGAGNHSFFVGAKNFLRRFPDPRAFAAQPLSARLAEGGNVRPLLTYLMLHGHLRPGYDYLLERKLHSVLREAPASPIGPDLARFITAAERIGYSPRARAGMASEVAARLLIQTGRPLAAIADADLAEFGAAVGERESRNGRDYKHYRHALYASSAVIYHLGGPGPAGPQAPDAEQVELGTPPRWRRRRPPPGHGRLSGAVLGDAGQVDGVWYRQRARSLRPLSCRQAPGTDELRRP